MIASNIKECEMFLYCLNKPGNDSKAFKIDSAIKSTVCKTILHSMRLCFVFQFTFRNHL